tara:strand:+ start:13876 stop:14445 length:570 start_codon:yes stop_codon:yes gene_type:complete
MISKQEAMEIAFSIPGQTWPSELGWIYERARHHKTKLYIDVGTFCGRSLWAAAAGMSSHGEGGRVVAVDNFTLQEDPVWSQGVIGLTISMIKRRLNKVDARFLKTSSLDAMRHPITQGADFVFIDANHEYAECKADIEGWSAVACDGATISGHDYWPAHVGVMDAVNHFYKDRFTVAPETRIWHSKASK